MQLHYNAYKCMSVVGWMHQGPLEMYEYRHVKFLKIA